MSVKEQHDHGAHKIYQENILEVILRGTGPDHGDHETDQKNLPEVSLRGTGPGPCPANDDQANYLIKTKPFDGGDAILSRMFPRGNNPSDESFVQSQYNSSSDSLQRWLAELPKEGPWVPIFAVKIARIHKL